VLINEENNNIVEIFTDITGTTQQLQNCPKHNKHRAKQYEFDKHSSSSQTNNLHFFFKRSIDLAIILDFDLTVDSFSTWKRLL
jgi:hypothetical protein